mmetsp:Transcript_1519/g.3210  ORF Transcript_1519/g.3210 Transcript_1519/m.3210 type:complete len:202 (-) Transcript_1519:44-649(-)
MHATTMSQITSLVRALKVVAKSRFLVMMVNVAAVKAHAPTGMGFNTRPTTVLRKMASRFHACTVRVGGTGTRNFTARPTAMDIAAGTSLMPSASGSGVASAAAAAAQGMTPRRSAVRRAGRDRAGALILDPVVLLTTMRSCDRGLARAMVRKPCTPGTSRRLSPFAGTRRTFHFLCATPKEDENDNLWVLFVAIDMPAIFR